MYGSDYRNSSLWRVEVNLSVKQEKKAKAQDNRNLFSVIFVLDINKIKGKILEELNLIDK